MELFPKRLY